MKTIMRMLGAGLLLSMMLQNGAALAAYDEGIEYRQISTPVPLQTDKPREVVELFWYGCPHCYQFEPKLTQWLKNKPKDVGFMRIPAVFVNPQTGKPSPHWAFHAKVFYTAEVLGVLDKVHKPFFDAIHAKGKRMQSLDEVETFFAEHGVKPETFRNAFNSFAVDSKLRRSIDLSERYGASGVPTLVVNGKYITDGPMSGGHDAMLEIVNQLLKSASD